LPSFLSIEKKKRIEKPRVIEIIFFIHAAPFDRNQDASIDGTE